MTGFFGSVTHIVKLIASALAVIIIILPVIVEGQFNLLFDRQDQKNRIAALEQAYEDGTAPHIDESSFFEGNLQQELDSGIKFNELSFIATHNSYETESVSAYTKMCSALSNIVPNLIEDGSGTLNHQTLTEQLNCGIRSFEIDVEAGKSFGKTSFYCMHNPVITMTTSCYDFSLALKEICMWSDYNPNHLPITIMIEPKEKFVPMGNLRWFSAEYAQELDSFLRENLGDKLFTPSDMLRDYNSFYEMRQNDDWCKVSDMLGKVIVLLHFSGDITPQYIELDPTVRTQAMFPAMVSAHADYSYTAFIITNDAVTARDTNKSMVADKKLVVRTRVDTHPSYSEERRAAAMESCSQIMSTDFPIRTYEQSGYYVAFENDKTVKSIKPYIFGE